MKIHYTGKLENVDAAGQKKLDAHIAKLGKFLDGKSEKECHVILTSERHLRRAEITVNFQDRTMACRHSAKDALDAVIGACDKLEKQILKLRDKRFNSKRKAAKPASGTAVAAEPEPAEEAGAGPKVFRVNHASRRKPMTVEEAILEINNKKNYLVYRDAERDTLSVLIRRADGHFDLVES